MVNACANAADFTGDWEEPTARIPSPLLALVQPSGLLSSTGPWPPWPCCPGWPATEAAAGTLRAGGFWSCAEEGEQETQGEPYLRDKLALRVVFKAFVKCSQVCRGKSLSPIAFQWSGPVFMLMAVAAGIPELLWGDCSCTSVLGRRSFTNWTFS